MSAGVPVALFAFNRPETVDQVLAALRPVGPPLVLVVVDGPRPGQAGDVTACAEVRARIRQGIDWRCDVQWNVAAENLGCARRVSSGLDWVFGRVEQAVILEDDCVPDARFIPFCAELLERYREAEAIGVIAGSNFQVRDVTQGAGCYFSRYPHCWGWATWRRAWAAYDHTMKDWPEVRQTDWLRGKFETQREARYWRDIFDRVFAGEIDSWAYRWTYACWRRGFLTALPAANLVRNIGFGSDATHTRRAGIAPAHAAEQPWPLRPPAVIARHAAADAYTAREVFGLRPWPSRIVRKLSAILH